MSVTIYVNGEHVKEEDLEKIEITNEKVKKIFSEKLTRNEKDCRMAVG